MQTHGGAGESTPLRMVPCLVVSMPSLMVFLHESQSAIFARLRLIWSDGIQLNELDRVTQTGIA